MENKGTRLITIIIIAVAVVVSLILIVVLDGAERSAIAAATNDNTILNPVVGSQEPTYEHDDFLKCSAIYKKESNKVICYIQNTSSASYVANYTVSFKDENNHEIGHTSGTSSEILSGDYTFVNIENNIPANTAKVDLYAKAGAINTKPFKIQMQTAISNGNVQVSIPAYDTTFSMKEVQVCFMDDNNSIIDVQIYPLAGTIPANTPQSIGSLPMGSATQVAVNATGYLP